MATNFLYLTILPHRIDAKAWSRVYDQIHRLWQGLPAHAEALQHDTALLSLHLRPGLTVPRRVYTQELEHFTADGLPIENDNAQPRRLETCGDAASRQIGPTFSIYHDLDVYRRRASVLPPAADASPDILLPDANHSGEVAVFSGETLDLPYGRAILAAAMLIEARFPGAALCLGEIDAAQAQKAADYARGILQVDLPLPVSVDPSALWRRLSAHLSGDALWNAVLAWFRGDAGVIHEDLLRRSEPEESAAWLRRELLACHLPTQYAVGQRVVEWLNATTDLETLLRIACLDPAGPRFPPEQMISIVSDTGVTCSPMTRQGLRAILSAPRPRGAVGVDLAQRLERQLKKAVKDLQLIGRRLQVYIPLGKAKAAVRHCFKDQRTPDGEPLADVLVRRLHEETETRMQILADLRGPVLRSVDAFRSHLAELDPVHLLCSQRVADLPPRAQQALLVFGTRVWSLQRRLQRDLEFAAFFDGPLDALRARSVVLLEHRGEALTEEAWAELDGGVANDNGATEAPPSGVLPMPTAPSRSRRTFAVGAAESETQASLWFLVALVLTRDPALRQDPAATTEPSPDGKESAVLTTLQRDRQRQKDYRRALLENGALRRDLVRSLWEPDAGASLANEELEDVALADKTPEYPESRPVACRAAGAATSQRPSAPQRWRAGAGPR